MLQKAEKGEKRERDVGCRALRETQPRSSEMTGAYIMAAQARETK